MAGGAASSGVGGGVAVKTWHSTGTTSGDLGLSTAHAGMAGVSGTATLATGTSSAGLASGREGVPPESGAGKGRGKRARVPTRWVHCRRPEGGGREGDAVDAR